MKLVLFLLLILCFTSACAKEPANYPPYEKCMGDLLPKKQSKEELSLTELDDMTTLFPFKEQLDPKDPSLCVETIAKKQQDDFIKSQTEIELTLNK